LSAHLLNPNRPGFAVPHGAARPERAVLDQFAQPSRHVRLYNRSIPGALKNAMDYLYREWNNKAAGLVGYGAGGGHYATAALRAILSELKVAHVRSELSLSLNTDFEDFSIFRPNPDHEETLNRMLDELIAWSGALRGLREASAQTG
jgi:Predicted flavoprotein